MSKQNKSTQVGNRIILNAANNKQQRRYSGLRRRLKEGYHEQ